jgi:hypothetical protein
MECGAWDGANLISQKGTTVNFHTGFTTTVASSITVTTGCVGIGLKDNGANLMTNNGDHEVYIHDGFTDDILTTITLTEGTINSCGDDSWTGVKQATPAEDPQHVPEIIIMQ